MNVLTLFKILVYGAPVVGGLVFLSLIYFQVI